ncbi:SWIB/MDM2 domain-containing protein [Pavlovales sp. CCMP2436]|nr:SWIB/MDM2 domain-containing protein [Pavlovales sp. CCMP2436]
MAVEADAEGKPAKGAGKAAEPGSEEEWAKIETRLAGILAAADLTELTTKTVRKQLETEFGCSLGSDKSKLWIKEQINAFVAKQDGEEEEEEEAEEEEPARKRRKAAPVPKKTAASVDKEKSAKLAKKAAKKAAGGAESDCEEDPRHPPLSDQMAAIVGVQRATRFRLVKLLWRYIKQHELQDPSDKRFINCDVKLQKAFGQERVSAFSMSKFLGPHLLSAEDEDDEEEEEATTAVVKGKSGSKPAAKLAAKRAPGSGGGAKAPKAYTGSAELAKFVGEETNNRFAITKAMWAYIKEHSLQSIPGDKRRIVCDATFKKLFKVDEMTAFSLAKHIATHFPAKVEKA